MRVRGDYRAQRARKGPPRGEITLDEKGGDEPIY